MRVLLLLVPILVLAGDHSCPGERAFDEGRFDDALAALTRAEKADGDGAPAALLFNRALAALRAGDPVTAELAAEKAAVRDGPGFDALRDFLFGNAAFVRCERAEIEADRPDADPAAFEKPIAFARASFEAWRRAASSRADWPAARRNVERALLKIETLRAKQQAAREQNSRKKGDGTDETPAELMVDDDPAHRAGAGGEGEEARVTAPDGELPAGAVEGLLEKLAGKEKEKRALRRTRRDRTGGSVEKDW